MKKSFLALSVICFVGASISLTSASRYAYHQYQKQSQYRTYNLDQANRYYTNRISPWAYERNYRSRVYQAQLRSQRAVNNYQIPTSDRLRYKLERPGLYPRILNNYQTEKYIVRGPRDYSVSSTRISTNGKDPVQETAYQAFRMNPGAGFSQDAKGVYRAPGTSLAFKVTSYQAQFNCNKNTFAACASRLTNNFIVDQKLSRIVNKKSDLRLNQTQHLDFSFYPSITESFQANGNTYFLFTALNPVDQKVVRIESVARTSEEARAAVRAFDIFETFRFVDNQ